MLVPIARLPQPIRRLASMAGTLERSVLALCLFIIITSVTWGVLTRYVSKAPATWTGEIAAMAFCWLGMFGASWIYAAHPRLFDPSGLPNRGWRAAAMAASVALEAVVLLFVLIYAIRQSLVNVDNLTPSLQLPTSVYYVPIAWFALSSLLRLAFRRD